MGYGTPKECELRGSANQWPFEGVNKSKEIQNCQKLAGYMI
jgi:hypothetical protein